MEGNPDPRGARRALVATWAKAIGLLAIARAASTLDPTGLARSNLGAVAALLFILLPDRELRRRGETWGGQGLPWWGATDARTWRAWARGALEGLAICAVVLPVFALAFLGFAEIAARLNGPRPDVLRLPLRLPAGFALLAVTQLLVVALPEEMFYRGYLQTGWARSAPGRRVRVLGADLGAGFLSTQLLFAAGHLVSLDPWRLLTFFPALLFGWARERTNGLAAPVFVHAVSNLFLAVLEAGLPGAR
ncbi:MAG TPA: CPBP family intramembrane glutamic endopeptidase [Anaeromyxobacteraceae bacterium]|nr:CPBP family intramembrane glutamic endopeptidase [Anaeromyxobacteraceae bacterium]